MLLQRHLPLVITAALTAASPGCDRRSLDPFVLIDGGTPTGPSLLFSESFPAQPPTALDVLFVIDNSSGMEPFIGVLPEAMRSFVAVLRSTPGGLPDLHAGVVTTDMGTGGVISGVPGCNKYPVGDDGTFVVGPSLPFAWDEVAGKWNPAPSVGCGLCGTFIAEPSNAAGPCPSVEDALACLASVGTAGCLYEQPLAAARRALLRTDTAFLRPGAQLAVVIVTNEDDCSLPEGSMLLDPQSSSVADGRGPLTSYRCNRFGHFCDGAQPPGRPGDLTSGWPYSPRRCESWDDGGYLVPDGEILHTLQALKQAASLVSLSVIAGPPTMDDGRSAYSVVLDPAIAAEQGHPDEEWPRVQPACGSSTDTGTADPAVRLQQLTDMFGAHGRFASICSSGLTSQLEAAARGVLAAMTHRCLSRGGKFDTVIEKLASGGEVVIPPCAASDGGNVPCWSRNDHEPACRYGSSLVLSGDLAPGVLQLR